MREVRERVMRAIFNNAAELKLHLFHPPSLMEEKDTVQSTTTNVCGE